MRKVLILAAALALAPVARADEAAVTVVKKAVEAHGGEKALTAIKGMELTLKATLTILGQEVEFEGEASYSLPDKMATALTGEVMNQKIAIVQVINGDKAKLTANGMAIPVEDKQKDEMTQGVADQEIGLIAPLLDGKKYTLTAEADEKVGDAEAAVVRVVAKGRKDTKLFFDKKTFLLVRMQRQGLNQEGQEVDSVSDLSEYKKVDGIQTATAVKVTHDGKPFMAMKLSDVKYLDKAEDGKKYDTGDK
jgi:outer membrane lipoprotein-sorting protein